MEGLLFSFHPNMANVSDIFMKIPLRMLDSRCSHSQRFLSRQNYMRQFQDIALYISVFSVKHVMDFGKLQKT